MSSRAEITAKFATAYVKASKAGKGQILGLGSALGEVGAGQLVSWLCRMGIAMRPVSLGVRAFQAGSPWRSRAAS
jgi:hypothetical protein